MTPFIGQRVIVLGVYSNGVSEAPGIVTRSWGFPGQQVSDMQHICVNLHVFPDAAPPLVQTSVPMLIDRRSAAASSFGQVCYPAP